MSPHVYCPGCKSRVSQAGGGTVKIRTRGVLVFQKSGDGIVALAQCPKCRGEVELPISLDSGPLEKSMDAAPRLTIRGR